MSSQDIKAKALLYDALNCKFRANKPNASLFYLGYLFIFCVKKEIQPWSFGTFVSRQKYRNKVKIAEQNNDGS